MPTPRAARSPMPDGGAPPVAATHLGLTVPPNDLPVDELPALARRAETLGYSELWTYERELFDAFSPLAAAAAATERIRLGTGIANVYTRPAGLTAMSAASLAQLAPGRFVSRPGSLDRDGRRALDGPRL